MCLSVRALSESNITSTAHITWQSQSCSCVEYVVSVHVLVLAMAIQMGGKRVNERQLEQRESAMRVRERTNRENIIAIESLLLSLE